MKKQMAKRRAAVAAGALLIVAAPALAADSLSDSVERFLDSAQTKVEETKVWKFHIKPSLRESVIWTDNIDLNADDENPVRLTRVIGSGGKVINDPARLAQIAANNPDFNDTATEGRRSDFIIQSELGADLVLPVNAEYTKAFDQLTEMTIFGAKIRNQEYLDHNELDNNSVFLHTDVFGFISDWLNQEWGNGFWVRIRDDYSDVNDPLDASIRLLQQNGIGTVQDFNDFGFKENRFQFDAGYHGAKMDFSAGYENYHLWLNDRDLDQAEHGIHNFHAEVGSLVPGWEQQRAYLRYDYSIYHFARAPIQGSTGVVGEAQILNDATVNKGTLGLEGPMLSDKLATVFEVMYENWEPHDDGLAADRTHFSGMLFHVQAAYRPWEGERSTKFQFDYHRDIDYSAISNFNSTHIGRLSVLHEAIPKRLDLDFTISLSTTTPSDGPDRKLLETGAGATYHLYKQLDVSLRYVFRHQTARNEIVTSSAFESGGKVFQYTVKSDSEFVQNIIELGVLLHF